MAVNGPILASARKRAAAVRYACIDIYEPLLPGRSRLFFPDHELEALIADHLLGVELSGPIRRRSKIAKILVAEALGYGAPASFKRTMPRFPGQDLDVYVQTSDNLQIWNEDISPERRYVLLRPQKNGTVGAVRVVRGQQVARWDTTGTLTSKYQARRMTGAEGSKAVSTIDTPVFIREFSPGGVPSESLALLGSSQAPQPGSVLSIAHLYERLLSLIGCQLAEVGAEQDRTRGELLQEAVCACLGLRGHENYGQWPDIVCQALEVKLQTSPTIDLGLVLPTNTEPAYALGSRVRHCDARYLIAYGTLSGQGATTITDIVISTGMDFFREFQQFGGLIQNRKRQIKLPQGLFESQ